MTSSIGYDTTCLKVITGTKKKIIKNLTLIVTLTYIQMCIILDKFGAYEYVKSAFE